MASHLRDDILHGRDHTDTHASESRWRHQESASFLHHAHNAAPRDADGRAGSADLTAYLHANREEADPKGPRKQSVATPIVANGTTGVEGAPPDSAVAPHPQVKCGPLLNYRRMEGTTWFGSVLIVLNSTTTPPSYLPTLFLKQASGKTNGAHGAHGGTNGSDGVNGYAGVQVPGVKLYADSRNNFWRFPLQVEMEATETHWEYAIPGLSFASATKTDQQDFYVPAITESMRIMFHSCNGFSVGTDEAAWSGPALWNDVAREHAKSPFHVMLGGGDQIYNDGVRVHGPLREWTDIANPRKRRDYPFTEELRRKCDDYYVNNYIRWYSTEPFAGVNGRIPQVNLWDDHDIIDGFGSYVSDFMQCAVFRGIGGVAYKYYMLFQHHIAPPISTFTSDAPVQTVNIHSDVQTETVAPNPAQTEGTYVLPKDVEEPCYIIGPRPGPYVSEHSRNIYTRLGARLALVGIDARSERTRHQVNYPETYDLIFNRLREELGAARDSGKPIRHLIVLLGIPIAYPRLTWLENIFSSPVMGPIKFLNKRFGVAGGLFNTFDGSVDLLDDLDDHYTARTHKKERSQLIHRFQDIAGEFSVRITILGGDVHLAALGRFYSNPSLKLPVEQDHRFMINVVSSAIVNKPPPNAIANLLARRNKIHHLDSETDETLLNLFDRDPGDTQKTANNNHATMPSRNFARITENSGTEIVPQDINFTPAKDGHGPLHPGEVGSGTTHRAAGEGHGSANDGSLDIAILVEKDQHNPEGHTQHYGLTVPLLNCDRPPTRPTSVYTTRTTKTNRTSRPTTQNGNASVNGDVPAIPQQYQGQQSQAVAAN